MKKGRSIAKRIRDVMEHYESEGLFRAADQVGEWSEDEDKQTYLVDLLESAAQEFGEIAEDLTDSEWNEAEFARFEVEREQRREESLTKKPSPLETAFQHLEEEVNMIDVAISGKKADKKMAHDAIERSMAQLVKISDLLK